MAQGDTTRRRRALLGAAIALVERDYARRLDLDDVARELASSRRQLQRVFSECAGMSFRTLVGAVRMDAAARLLLDDTLRVRDVAPRVGYTQPAQFAKAFRRYHGVGPTEFRRRAAGHASDTATVAPLICQLERARRVSLGL